jgi:predicted transcriptional regulator
MTTKKERVLHYVALHPNCIASEVSDALGIPSNTVRNYLSDLGKEGKIESVKGRRWVLASHITVESLNIPPEPVKIKQPWEYLHDAVRSFYTAPYVSQ